MTRVLKSGFIHRNESEGVEFMTPSVSGFRSMIAAHALTVPVAVRSAFPTDIVDESRRI